MDDLTWTCHICEQERPDEFISVHKQKVLTDMDGLTDAPGLVTRNIRYCNDRFDCADGAINSPLLDLRTKK